MKPDTSRLATSKPTRNWLLDGASLIASDDHTFLIDRHGIDQYLASSIARHAIVVYGDLPRLVEITGDDKRIQDALSHVSPAGDLFTVFASVYRSGSQTVLLLDYLR